MRTYFNSNPPGEPCQPYVCNVDSLAWPKYTCPHQYILLEHGGCDMDNQVFEKVRDIIVDQLGVSAEQIVPEARFREDLKADSLDLVELIMRFEEEFGGEISDKDAEGITTVGEAVRYLQQHAAA